jgi:DNA-binding Lrp family transcriptional regulator
LQTSELLRYLEKRGVPLDRSVIYGWEKQQYISANRIEQRKGRSRLDFPEDQLPIIESMARSCRKEGLAPRDAVRAAKGEYIVRGWILIKTASDDYDRVRANVDRILKRGGVRASVSNVLGNFDLLCEFGGVDFNKFGVLLMQHINALRGVLTTQTYLLAEAEEGTAGFAEAEEASEDITGWVLIRTEPGNYRQLLDSLRGDPKVMEAHPIFGDYDLIVKVKVSHFDELVPLVLKDIHQSRSVVGTATYLRLPREIDDE